MVTSPARFGSRVDVTSPSSVATAEFNTARRGFDRDEVRTLLAQVAAELARLRNDNVRLTDELEAARVVEARELDEAMVAELLGAEAARVLAAAKEAAAQIRINAEDTSNELQREAREDAARLREDAVLEASRRRQEIDALADAELDAAKVEGRHMVAEARAVRERMLTDLARRRDAARAQLERLRDDRDRLVASFEHASRAAADVLAGLRDAAPEPVEVESVDAALASVVSAVDVEDVDASVEIDESEDADDAEPVALSAVTDATEGDQGDASAVADQPTVFHLGEEPAPTLSYAGELDTEVERRSSVDDLFARIRAGGPAEVVAEVEGSTSSNDAADGESADAADAPDDQVDEESPDVVYLAERAAALDPLQASVARNIKRALTDEQNEVLDGLRRQAAPHGLDALIGAPDEHAARYRRALTVDLHSAASAGARSMGFDSDALSGELMDAVVSQVDVELTAPLRERLEKALDDAGGDAVEAGATLRAAYREWRTQRADEVAAHLVLLAHGGGSYDAVETGTPIRWVVDPEGPLCPDADDNALGGVIAAGDEFPTGHCHAPAHPGCCCGIVRTQG